MIRSEDVLGLVLRPKPNWRLLLCHTRHSLSNVLERWHQNQLGFQAAVVALMTAAENEGLSGAGAEVRGALWMIGQSTGHIKQGLAKLKQNVKDTETLSP